MMSVRRSKRGGNKPYSPRERLFVYGTLRYAKYQREAFGRVTKGKRSVLTHFARSVGANRYFIIRPKRRSRVNGLVIVVTNPVLRQIDAYEQGYVRKKVRLTDDTDAWTYTYPLDPTHL